MQDFWQILGRIIADDDFRGSVAAATKDKVCKVNAATAHGLEMDGLELKALHTAIDPTIEGPISLFALGETMRIGTGTTKDGPGSLDFLDSTEKIAQSVKDALGNSVTPVKKEFYTALGAMVASAKLRDAIAQPGVGVPADFSAGCAENKQLVAIARSESFQTEASDYCPKYWLPGCLIALDFYEGYLQPATTLVIP